MHPTLAILGSARLARWRRSRAADIVGWLTSKGEDLADPVDRRVSAATGAGSSPQHK
jgi:hypothetical protein